MEYNDLNLWPKLKPADTAQSAIDNSQWEKLNKLVEDEELLGHVEDFIKDYALENRLAATNLVRLIEWVYKADKMPGHMASSWFPALVKTLLKFPDSEKLHQYLQTLKIVSDEQYDTKKFNHHITAVDFIRTAGDSYVFYYQSDHYPAGHEQRLAEIVENTPLASAKFSETPPIRPEDWDDTYTLQGAIDGQSAKVSARNHGASYDAHAMVKLLNKLAKMQSLNERFAHLHPEDELELIWKTNAFTVKKLLSDGLIVMSL